MPPACTVQAHGSGMDAAAARARARDSRPIIAPVHSPGMRAARYPTETRTQERHRDRVQDLLQHRSMKRRARGSEAGGELYGRTWDVELDLGGLCLKVQAEELKDAGFALRLPIRLRLGERCRAHYFAGGNEMVARDATVEFVAPSAVPGLWNTQLRFRTL